MTGAANAAKLLYQTDDGTTRVEVRMAGEAIKPL